MPHADRLADVVAITTIAFVLLDPSARAAEVPLMLLSVVTSALLLWFVVRFCLARQPARLFPDGCLRAAL